MDKFFIFTGELGKKRNNVAEVRKVIGTKFVDKLDPSLADQILVDTKDKEISTSQIYRGKKLFQTKYVVGQKLQSGLPMQDGYFENFKIIPADKDLKLAGRGYFYQSYFDNEGFSAVQCFWFDKQKVFGVHAYEPLCRSNRISLPIWTDENPKK